MKIFSDSSLIEIGFLENRRKCFSHLGIVTESAVGVDLVHGNNV